MYTSARACRRFDVNENARVRQFNFKLNSFMTFRDFTENDATTKMQQRARELQRNNRHEMSLEYQKLGYQGICIGNIATLRYLQNCNHLLSNLTFNNQINNTLLHARARRIHILHVCVYYIYMYVHTITKLMLVFSISKALFLQAIDETAYRERNQKLTIKVLQEDLFFSREQKYL